MRARQRKDSTGNQSVFLTIAFGALLVAVAVSGISLVNNAHVMRSLYSAQGQIQRDQDRLLEEHSRLMLERGALTSMQNIEVVAQGELGMRFPEQIGQVLQ